MSENHNQQSSLRRLRLRGARFDGGRLPVDSLVELQSYQKIIRIAAEAEWRRDHPEEKLPEELRDSIRLTIERIEDGSAEIFLAYEQHAEYVEYQLEAQNTTDAVLVAAYEDNFRPELPGFPPEMSYEYREAVSELGVTLVEHQSIEVYIGEAPVTITPRSRERALELLSPLEDFLLEPAFEEIGTGLETVPDVSLVGRVTVLDTDRERFVITLDDGAKVHGWYRQNHHLLEDLRKVVHSSQKGSLTRISGDLQYKDGDPFRFKEARSVERVEFDKTAWGFRLTEFASLTPGWDDGDGKQITSAALDAAQMLLRAVDDVVIVQPGIFPTDEGGVLIEWASPVRVRSVEVTPEGTFELFALYQEQHEAEHDSTADLTRAIAFVEVEKA